MNHSGDAAEQIVRMTLEGAEVALKITGTAAKEIALLLIAALKSPDNAGGHIKLKGKERLNSMLKSTKELDIFSVKERDLRTFVREAKNYGIVYCVLRNSTQDPDGLCDIMVKAEDSPKINRLVERFKFATVDKARIESEVLRDMAAQAAETPAEQATPTDAQPGEPEINDVNSLLNDLLGTDEGKTAPDQHDAAPVVAHVAGRGEPKPAEPEKPVPKKTALTAKKDAPTAEVKTEPDPLANGGKDSPQPPRSSPSELSSDSRKKSENPTLNKPSVKKELREITTAKKAKEAEAIKRDDVPPTPAKAKESQTTTHKQPQNRRKPKSKKER